MTVVRPLEIGEASGTTPLGSGGSSGTALCSRVGLLARIALARADDIALEDARAEGAWACKLISLFHKTAAERDETYAYEARNSALSVHAAGTMETALEKKRSSGVQVYLFRFYFENLNEVNNELRCVQVVFKSSKK